MSLPWDLVRGLGDQLRWAAAREVPAMAGGGAPAVVLVGMGGSGISGDIARPVAEAAGTLLHVHKAYGLPGWYERMRPLVIAVSYSGTTEETASAIEMALAAGLPVAAVTSGGTLADTAVAQGWPLVTVPGALPPRAAVGYLAGSVLRLLEAAGSIGPVGGDLEAAADVVDEIVGDGGETAGVALARDLADGLVDRVAVLYGCDGPSAPAALRWKTQINENAKAPAWAGLLPEVDHNEILGWDAFPELARRHLGVVMLRDRGESEQMKRRIEVTQRLYSGRVELVGEVWSQGESVLARTFSLIAVGDMVSVALAELAHVDPMDIEIIEQLKREMR